MESNLSGLVPAARLVPALPPAVTLGLTAAYTTLYALLFFSVYAQLWLVLLYGHKRLSYQTVFLALCLLWAALCTTLFSFYFRDSPRANRLGPMPFWLRYCCPVCLQFFTLTLMNLYFAQVVFKAKAKRRPEMSRGLLAVRGAFAGASLLFLLVNVLCCAVLSRRRRAQPWALLLVRVLVSDCLYVICALSLAACLCLVARRAPSTSIYLEAKGTRVCQAAAMGGAMVLLYASRACYNLAALALAPRSRLDAFDYDWYNVSDQADLVNDLGNKGYLVFGLILCVWELLPTALLVGFFRVHGPPQDLVFGSPSDFFDRAGHCEDEGCSWERGRSESTSMSGSLGSGSWYGAMGREPAWCGDSQTRTTALLFSQVLRPGGHHRSLHHPADVIPFVLPPEHPDHSPPIPGPATPPVPSSPAASCPGSWEAVAASSPGQLLATLVVVSLCCPLGWGAWPWLPDALQHLGMTCRLCFYTGASYLSCTCGSINSVCAPQKKINKRFLQSPAWRHQPSCSHSGDSGKGLGSDPVVQYEDLITCFQNGFSHSPFSVPRV
ncbi:LOW QUALITY PROTEIN: integral membrane protein GPR137-like [Panthera uncia]|uniref:LOW QUALITY PROTEIN: integral membrane protein GPR137-like n=1 Tax=Panthera uncia TaxID=29064 RepID=UPI0020FFDEC6|nr:LOW QUALITY PROTEIN: integral membrane protein GPR137-like [Panthera uncia]